MVLSMTKPEPLPPIGYIRLDEAFSLLKHGALGPTPSLENGYTSEHKAYGQQEDALGDDFIANLNSFELGAEVYSETGTRHAIANDTFSRTTFPTLLLLHRAIPSGLGGPLSNYVGGIICLRRQGFEEWAKRWVRDYLFEELRYGRVSLDDARARANEVGIDSLEGNPGPNDFNPMEETYWTLAMAVAWIAWRRPVKVRDHWNKYRERCSYFHFEKWRVGFDGSIHEGWLCDNRAPATLLSLMLDETSENSRGDENEEDEPQQSTQLFTVKKSREDLWRKLQNGELIATGKRQLSERNPIDSYRWQDLEIHGDGEKQEYVSPKFDISDNARLHEVTVKTSDLLALWPDSDAKTKYFMVWLNHEIDLARRALNEAWKSIDAKAAAEHWHMSGRRIKTCIRSMADTTGQLTGKVFDRVTEAENALEHHSLADKALSGFLRELAAKTPALVTTSNGTPRALEDANSLVKQIQSDLETASEIARLSIRARQVGAKKTTKETRKNSTALAIESLWKGRRPPQGLSVKARNVMIRNWITNSNLSKPSTDAALNRAAQRAIRELE